MLASQAAFNTMKIFQTYKFGKGKHQINMDCVE